MFFNGIHHVIPREIKSLGFHYEVEFMVVGDTTLGAASFGILLSAALLFQINHTDVRKHCGVACDEWFSQNLFQALTSIFPPGSSGQVPPPERSDLGPLQPLPDA